ncbi:DegT/DnrJ/EryC1/StrS aminotransferase family protein [Polynucleobacter sp. MG-28-Ekke-A2]|uniref:DegT/DnrJ/EryC1/StrS family aminotransferase n=1 Tax=Polynucleobacter sp. MG-28-Ekke-A2 TaxID=3108276 RepID=UPI002B224284|nr:DegT/DnrJ/EryC1/StrS aminotransferase family protein [Polynucleobacter sp. MG-28-Ekke-A2]MEA9601204.1 DegT/DnrJ/EryC1/StrS aminotransferase family protein [Polynucleobacter sp. MG-28-Ekke-A2]
MLNTPFSPWPSFTEEEALAIQKVLLSNKVNYWTGDECRQFETEFAVWSDTKYAIALANGTLALELALKALDIGPGDEVIVSPRTFIASISCVVAVGATPVFADVDPESGNITAQTIARALTNKTKAVICVHLAGWPCDMDPIMNLAKTHNLKVIEDCAQAHGARYKGRSVGSIGDIGAWSFCQDKIMTTGGEGGMVTTNDEAVWAKMWSYKDHGKSYQAVYQKKHPPGFRWLHESFGSNYRMIEIQGAIGRIQLKKMAEWTRLRNANARSLQSVAQEFSGKDGLVRVPKFKCGSCSAPISEQCSQGCMHAQYKVYFYIQPENLAEGWCRDRIIEEINQRGIPCYQGSCSEVYLEKAFDGTGLRPEESLPNAKQLGDTSIMFLVHPTLTNEEIQLTQKAMREVFLLASKAHV